jgi:hypothetical protein
MIKNTIQGDKKNQQTYKRVDAKGNRQVILVLPKDV